MAHQRKDKRTVALKRNRLDDGAPSTKRKKRSKDRDYSSGRDTKGRFTKGNPGGPGNPRATRVTRLREALLSNIDDNTIRRVIRALVREAENGNVTAAKELLDRCFGRSVQPTIDLDADYTSEADLTFL